MSEWLHQTTGVARTLAELQAGVRRVLLTSPTGGGKTAMAAKLAEHYWNTDRLVTLVTDRRLMIDQLLASFRAHGLDPGVRAAGKTRTKDAKVQISSIQTEWSRVKKSGEWAFHPADLAIIDEAHRHVNEQGQWFQDRVLAGGGSVVGVTATPIDLGSQYDRLIVAGTTSELRACGALVPAIHYGPDEPDLRKLKKLAQQLDRGENAGEKALQGLMNGPKLFGRVWKHFAALNPERRPSVLFAPGVAESLWFAEQFVKMGVPAAHLDGDSLWANGEWWTHKEARDDLKEASRTGKVVVVCNRFVLREGVDWPWLAHGVLATVFGSLASYLQAGGRLLRACDGKPVATIQDHGGHWHRHGSLNADRDWQLDWSERMYVGVRAEKLRQKKCADCYRLIPHGEVWCPKCGGLPADPEPVRCPRCGAIYGGFALRMGFRCNFPGCGYEFRRSYVRSRAVVTAEGDLSELRGDAFTPRRERRMPDTLKLWVGVYFRFKKAGKSFTEAEGYFASQHYYHPPRTLPLMPVEPADWFRRIKDVPESRLTAGYAAVKNTEGEVADA